jgi:DNA-binding response OmpR family regulator
MGSAGAPILVVEDEPRYARLLSIILEGAGYRAQTAATGAEALEAAQAGPFELILLDLGLPDRDGAELCRAIRAFSDTPIIVVTARTSLASRVSGLDLGADDYLTKPFAPEELLARIRAVLRRARARPAAGAAPLVRLGDLSVDLVGGSVRIRDAEVSLTPKEYQLLATLVRHRGQLLPADTILELVWGRAYVGEHYLVRLFVSRLRRKIGDDPRRPRYIETKPGIGYRFPPSAREPRRRPDGGSW